VERKSHSVGTVTKRGINSTPAPVPTDVGESTRAFYETHAHEYFDRTVSADLSSIYDRFLKYVKPGGRILDAGCGSGRDLKALRNRGFDPVGIDASPEMAKLAAEFSGSACLPMLFEELRFDRPFDAVWACASLLHIPKHNLLSVLRRLHGNLVAGGILFASVKVGEGEELSSDGRFFAYYAPDEFERFLAKAGFCVNQLWISKDSLSSRRRIRWLNVIAHRRKLGP
jgi:SAM-dependent methyltransferase